MIRYALAVFLLSLSCLSAKADEYYCLIFAWDSKIPTPSKTHTWGTFAHVSEGKLVKEATLSWTPQEWKYSDRPTSAYHMSLRDTMDFAADRKWVIRCWGPYRISEQFYKEGVRQYERTDMKYKFLDARQRVKSRGQVVNCIHCLSDVAGPHKTYVKWGWWASDSVVRHFDKKRLLTRAESEEKERVIKLLRIDGYDTVYQ
jgi:hypothetical protein